MYKKLFQTLAILGFVLALSLASEATQQATAPHSDEWQNLSTTLYRMPSGADVDKTDIQLDEVLLSEMSPKLAVLEWLGSIPDTVSCMVVLPHKPKHGNLVWSLHWTQNQKAPLEVWGPGPGTLKSIRVAESGDFLEACYRTEREGVSRVVATAAVPVGEKWRVDHPILALPAL